VIIFLFDIFGTIAILDYIINSMFISVYNLCVCTEDLIFYYRHDYG